MCTVAGSPCSCTEDCSTRTLPALSRRTWGWSSLLSCTPENLQCTSHSAGQSPARCRAACTEGRGQLTVDGGGRAVPWSKVGFVRSETHRQSSTFCPSSLRDRPRRIGVRMNLLVYDIRHGWVTLKSYLVLQKDRVVELVEPLRHA